LNQKNPKRLKNLNQKQKIKQKLQQAIQNNSPLDWLLYETIKNATVTVGPVTIPIWNELNNNLQEYREVWRLITSQEGREYLKNNLDRLLDYIETLLPKEE
jgi:hypothetical protein